jgi:hypothetical protein
MNLSEYVSKHAVRGACTCGKCIDAPDNPQQKQPEGHTVDMAFFKVSKRDTADAKTFRSLVENEYPHWLEGGERSFIQMGAEMGDQGIAIMTIALGDLLDVWQALTPAKLSVPHEAAIRMAGMGLLSLYIVKNSEGGK